MVREEIRVHLGAGEDAYPAGEPLGVMTMRPRAPRLRALEEQPLLRIDPLRLPLAVVRKKLGVVPLRPVEAGHAP